MPSAIREQYLPRLSAAAAANPPCHPRQLRWYHSRSTMSPTCQARSPCPTFLKAALRSSSSVLLPVMPVRPSKSSCVTGHEKDEDGCVTPHSLPPLPPLQWPLFLPIRWEANKVTGTHMYILHPEWPRKLCPLAWCVVDVTLCDGHDC